MKTYRVCIAGFAHVHINDVASHFVDHPQTQLVGLADTKPVVPELKPGAPYTGSGTSDMSAIFAVLPSTRTGTPCWIRFARICAWLTAKTAIM